MKFYKEHVVTLEKIEVTEIDIHKKVYPNYKCCGIDLHQMKTGLKNGESYYNGGWRYFAK